MSGSALLTVVGSGTLLPSATRRSACVHLSPPAGGPDSPRGVLVDCGAGTLHGMAASGVAWDAVDVIVLTHFHADHSSDLVPILAALRFRERARGLTILGPEDVGAFLEALSSAWGAWVTAPGFPLDVVPIGPRGSWASGDGTLRVEAHPSLHRPTSVGCVLEGTWGRVGFTGDTGPSEELARFLRGCDVLVAECAVPDPPGVPGHLSPTLLAELASVAAPSLLLVTHVYPPLTPGQAAGEVGRRWRGRAVAADDGLRVRIDGSTPTVDPPAATG